MEGHSQRRRAGKDNRLEVGERWTREYLRLSSFGACSRVILGKVDDLGKSRKKDPADSTAAGSKRSLPTHGRLRISGRRPASRGVSHFSVHPLPRPVPARLDHKLVESLQEAGHTNAEIAAAIGKVVPTVERKRNGIGRSGAQWGYSPDP